MPSDPWKLHVRFCLKSSDEVGRATIEVRDAISAAGGMLSDERAVTEHGEPDNFGDNIEYTVTSVSVEEALRKLRVAFPDTPLDRPLSKAAQYNNYGSNGKGLGLVIHEPAQQ